MFTVYMVLQSMYGGLIDQQSTLGILKDTPTSVRHQGWNFHELPVLPLSPAFSVDSQRRTAGRV